jgi:predicted peptidase
VKIKQIEILKQCNYIIKKEVPMNGKQQQNSFLSGKMSLSLMTNIKILHIFLILAVISCSPSKKVDLVFNEVQITPWLSEVHATRSWTYSFYLYKPPEYSDSDSEYPLLIHLHGWGNFGTNPDISQLAQGALKPLYDAHNNSLNREGINDLNENIRHSFVIYPRLHFGADYCESQFGYWKPETLSLIIDYLYAAYPLDQSRLYITGLSWGGGGTWLYGLTYPERAAGIIPVCAAFPYCAPAQLEGIPLEEIDLSPLKRVPLWVFYSFDDGNAGKHDSWICNTLNTLTGSPDIMQHYTHLNGNEAHPADDHYTISYGDDGLGPWLRGVVYPTGDINYTLYDSGGHDAWTRTYANDLVWDWLYEQRRNPDK